MDKIDTITITCEGATTVSLDDISDLQGNLKDLSEDNYVKLRNSIITHGFSFPIFLWVDAEGKKWTIDAHQRLRTLKKMRDEGTIIPPLPADIIHANDKIHAKQKLLLLNSKFGEMTQEGFDEFIADVPMEDISDLLELPDVMFKEEQGEDTKKEEGNQATITCPNCGHKFQNKKEHDE